MSSVGSKSTSTSGQDEAVRAAREEYRKKEADLIKKHNKEIKALNDKYIEDIDRKDRQQIENLAETRTKSQEALTQRDVKYRKEMEDMRNMHTRQLEKLLQENRERVATQAATSRREIKQANLGKEDRVKELHDRYHEQHAAESKKFNDKLNELREDQKETVNSVRVDLNKAHEKEVENLQTERNETVADLKNEYRRLRQNTSRRLSDQEIRHMQDKTRLADLHMDSITNEAETHNSIQEMSREGYQENLKSVRDRMAKARERDIENQNDVTKEFQAEVKERLDTQVNRLERDLNRVRNESVIGQTQEKQKAQRQINNVRDAYQSKYDYLEKARLETLRQSNEINAQNIRQVKGEADKQMSDNSRYYRERMDIENFKNRQAIDNLEKDFALRQDYTAENAETRIKHIRQDAHMTEKELREYFKANVDVLRESGANEKRDLRLSLEKEKNQASQITKQQVHKQEVVHQRQIADTVSKYEKRLADLNDQFIREKRLRDNREKELVKALNRQKETEVEALRIQHEDQNRQARMAHEREVKDLSRRNQEKLDEVLRSIKKT